MHPHERLGVIGEIAEHQHAVHRHVGDETREAPCRTPLAKGPGELVHRLELGVAHHRVPVRTQVFPVDVERERDRSEDIEGAAPGGNRVRQIDWPPAPINPDQLALGDEARADGWVDIGKHRSSATMRERTRRAHARPLISDHDSTNPDAVSTDCRCLPLLLRRPLVVASIPMFQLVVNIRPAFPSTSRPLCRFPFRWVLGSGEKGWLVVRRARMPLPGQAAIPGRASLGDSPDRRGARRPASTLSQTGRLAYGLRERSCIAPSALAKAHPRWQAGGFDRRTILAWASRSSASG